MRISYTVSFLLFILTTISLATDAYARQEDPESDEIAYWVSRLDSIDSVYDPVVAKIAEYGEPAIPFLIERLRTFGKFHPSYSNNIPLYIAWVFKHMKSEKAIVPLLDLYLQQEENRNRFFTPISMILNERKDLWETPSGNGVDEDRFAVFQSILSWVVDNDFPEGAEHLKARQDALKESTIPFSTDFPGPGQQLLRQTNRDFVIISADELTAGCQFTLPSKEVHILNKEQMEKWAEAYGDYLYFRFHDSYFYTINPEEISADVPTPVPDQKGIEKIAFVSYTLGWQQSTETRKKIHYLSGGGAATVWIKRNGKWHYVTILCFWTS